MAGSSSQRNDDSGNIFDAEKLKKKLFKKLTKSGETMSPAKLQEFYEDVKMMLMHNPSIPPTGSNCYINDLPNEILVHIFALGVKMQEEEEEEEEGSEYDTDSDDNLEGEDEGGDEAEKKRSKDERKWALYKESLAHNIHALAAKGEGVEDEEGWETDDSDEDDDDDNYEGRSSPSSSSSGSSNSSEEEPSTPFQILVSHVCSRWRNLVLDTPSFWSKLNFAEGPPYERSRIWIERAKDIPLDLKIDCRVDDFDPVVSEEEIDGEPILVPEIDKEQLKTILDLIMPHVARWRSLVVLVTYYEYMHIALSRFAECDAAPEMETLELGHYEDRDEYEQFVPVEYIEPFRVFGSNMPKLKDLTLWGIHLDWEGSLPIFGCLTSLELAFHAKDVRPTYDTFSQMLKASSRLSTLSLALSGPADPITDWGHEIIELPSVDDLQLYYHDCQYIQQLMLHLITPNITSLILAYDGEDFTDFARQLTQPMPGKSTSILAGLKSLKLSGLPCDDRTVEKVYEQLNGLENLHLNCSTEEANAFFVALAKKSPGATSGAATTADSASTLTGCLPPTSNSALMTSKPGSPPPTSIYCPRLRSLQTIGISGSEMKSFVEMRKKAKAPIKSIYMTKHDIISEKEEKWLKNNVETFDYFLPSEEEFEDDLDLVDDDDDDSLMDEHEHEQDGGGAVGLGGQEAVAVEGPVVDGNSAGNDGDWEDTDEE